MASSDVVVRFLADTAQLQGATREVEGVGTRMRNVGRTIAGAIGGAAVIGAIAKTTQAASALNETVSKSDAIFGKSAKSVEKWADSAADGFGQSKQGALEAAATFGNMFDQLGTGEADTVRMSKRMTELASDFASFHDADITDVLEAQTAAFRGEYDALQKFVPTINAAAVETQALADTGKDNAKQLTAQEKAAATYKLMIEGAGKALGDYDRTADSAANQQRKFAAQMADLQATIGQALLPVLVTTIGVLSQVADAFQMLPGPVQSAVVAVGLFAAGWAVLGSLGVNIASMVTAVVGALPRIGSAFVTVGLNIAAYIERVGAARVATVALGTAFVTAGVAIAAYVWWQTRVDESVKRATEAGKRQGEQLVQNVSAGSSAEVALMGLVLAHEHLATKIASTREGLEKLNALPERGTESVATIRAWEAELIRLENKHGTVGDAIKKLEREQFLARKEEEARAVALTNLAAGTDQTTASTLSAISAMQQYANQLLAAQGGQAGYEAALLNQEAAFYRLVEAEAAHGKGSLEARTAANQLEIATIGVSAAAVKADADMDAFTSTLDGKSLPALNAMRQSLIDTAMAHAGNTEAVDAEIAMIDAYIIKILTTPEERKTKFTAETRAAWDEVEALNRHTDYATRLREIVVNVKPGAGWGTLGGAGAIVDIDQVLGTGGIVSGPRGSPQLVLAHGGETVLPTHTMGAEAAIANVMGGSSSTSSTFHITVNVPVGAQAAQVGASTVDAIKAYERQNGKSWRQS